MKKSLLLVLATFGLNAYAAVTVPIALVDEKGINATIGQVEISESPYGLVFTPALQGLTPGLHGFHLHQFANCENAIVDGQLKVAGAAGTHYDPTSSKKHGTPWGDGHLGDLPPLYVDNNGAAVQPVLAPRLKISDLKGRAIMIHANGDNHSDHPAKSGGGGLHVSCGAIN